MEPQANKLTNFLATRQKTKCGLAHNPQATGEGVPPPPHVTFHNLRYAKKVRKCINIYGFVIYSVQLELGR